MQKVTVFMLLIEKKAIFLSIKAACQSLFSPFYSDYRLTTLEGEH